METARGTGTDPKVPGVIRNLLDGHYRGVSDVRLRINFRDRIAAVEAERSATAREDRLGMLAADADLLITEALSSGELTEEQSILIEEARTSLLGTPSEGLEAGLTRFVEALREIGEEETAELEGLLGGLEQLLAGFREKEAAAEQASALPDLSGPTGNGVAYAKFLAIYEELYEANAASASDETVDTIA